MFHVFPAFAGVIPCAVYGYFQRYIRHTLWTIWYFYVVQEVRHHARAGSNLSAEYTRESSRAQPACSSYAVSSVAAAGPSMNIFGENKSFNITCWPLQFSQRRISNRCAHWLHRDILFPSPCGKLLLQISPRKWSQHLWCDLSLSALENDKIRALLIFIIQRKLMKPSVFRKKLSFIHIFQRGLQNVFRTKSVPSEGKG